MAGEIVVGRNSQKPAKFRPNIKSTTKVVIGRFLVVVRIHEAKLEFAFFPEICPCRPFLGTGPFVRPLTRIVVKISMQLCCAERARTCADWPMQWGMNVKIYT